MQNKSEERIRLDESNSGSVPWKFWGPYLSERQWGTVREDYSPNGSAWDYFTHDQARSRAYRWGEDGIAGYSDLKQRLCFGLALWNGADPILKERLFGLTNSEGNHGEDVKEYYFYLDSTPTHSYMRYLYKYPQREFPYRDLVETNRARSRHELEYELLQTGAFDENRYFDVFVDYAKQSPGDTLIFITAANRGPEAASLHVLPTLWFRNTWSWSPEDERPLLSLVDGAVKAAHAELGETYLHCEGAPRILFTENETNHERIFGAPSRTPYVKDAFHRYLIGGDQAAVNPSLTGTKACAVYKLSVPAGGSATVRLRLAAERLPDPFGGEFSNTFEARLRECDLFYDSITPPALSPDERLVMRQALAGMLWSKQYYFFDVDRWLRDHGYDPGRAHLAALPRNAPWYHMVNDDVISMPDKWEYPWYAAWDLAFHTVALSMVDAAFAKDQLNLMLQEVYLHPNGQIPAYEWNFGDVNPPVHAWAALFVYVTERDLTGAGDIEFLKNAFRKLLLNFTWWVNRKDPSGRNVFEGGFLGLDNIGVFDRSAPLPTGGSLEQADGTAWMAFFCQNMLSIAVELTVHDETYVELAYKFVEHFLWISGAMDRMGINDDDMWDEEDGFFYDLLRLPDGSAKRLKVRSMVGLLPLCATTVIPPEFLERFPGLMKRIRQFMARRPSLVANLPPPDRPGVHGRQLLAILNEDKLRKVLHRMLDESRFLSPHGIRSLSKSHQQDPYVFDVHGERYRVAYIPAESDNGMFGGNSNWRGPVWMPINALIVRALMLFYQYYGEGFRIECPTGSGREMNLFEVAREISSRLSKTFLLDAEGHRPVFGGAEKFQSDPHWRDNILFYEYFHGDNGAGLGASHQTGWTGIVARLIQTYGHISPEQFLNMGFSRQSSGAFQR